MSHQLQPLHKRLTRNQSDRRDRKIEARRIVAAQLTGRINDLGGYTVQFVYRGFWQRLRWLILGERRPKQTQNTEGK
jgi:hypothetical protein